MAARFHELEKQLEDQKTSSRKEKQAFEEELRKTISEKEKAAYEAEFLKKEEIHKAEETIRKEKDEEISVLQKQLFDMHCSPTRAGLRIGDSGLSSYEIG